MPWVCFISQTQVILNGFAWPYLFNYRFVCILRNFFGTSSTQISLYLKCLIIFDVWSSTSRHASIRQWNSVKRARYLILITVIFWMLHTTPYKNVTSLQNNRRTIQLQRQFFRMILTQVLVTLISFVPYTLQLTYSTITTYWVKDAQWLATDNVIVQISRMCFYINNVIECYLYMMCSSEVRLTFKQVILKWELLHRNHRVTAFISTLPGTNTRS
ncbi:hypothetical protein I4U23_000263 [Adineta vaga]|nr:hypothetical protein I4U23_000263 [Adineta vaga]